MSELSQQQINQKRRQKILARSRKNQLRQQESAVQAQPKVDAENIEQNAPLLKTQAKQPFSQKGHNQTSQQEVEQADAFARFRQMQIKVYRQRMLLLLSKILGLIIGSIQLYLLSVIKKYQLKLKTREITQIQFQQIQQKFYDEFDLIYWALFGVIIFTWIWIKCNFYIKDSKSTSKNLSNFQIIPGSTMVSVLEQLNKVLQYKVLIKALLGYTFSCIVLQLLLNQVVLFFGFQNMFFKPDLVKILGQGSILAQNADIL